MHKLFFLLHSHNPHVSIFFQFLFCIFQFSLSHIVSLTHSLPPTPTHSLPPTHPPTHSLTLSLTQSLTHTHSLTHSSITTINPHHSYQSPRLIPTILINPHDLWEKNHLLDPGMLLIIGYRA
jgi:hypothetical protein